MGQKIKKLLTSEKGSITVLVVAAMLFMIVILALSFMGMSNKTSTQMSNIKQIEAEYASEQDIEQVYKETIETIDRVGDIKITPSTTEWTNGDVTVTIEYQKQLTENRKAGIGSADTPNATSLTLTENGTVYAEAYTKDGHRRKASLQINNIDKVKPTAIIRTNGGSYVMPTKSDKATIKTRVNVNDLGGSELKDIKYAWSQSKDVEPTSWQTFGDGDTVTKNDCTIGTYYLWLNVTDNAGNRADTKVSNAFIVRDSSNAMDNITFKVEPDGWTNKDVKVTVIYGDNLTENRKAGPEGEDLKPNATTVTMTENGKVVAEAEDPAGNKVIAEIVIDKIDKVAPVIKTVTNPSNGNWTNQNVTVTLVAEDNLSGIKEFQWFENGEWTTRALETNGNTGTITYTAERDTTIRFRVIDNAGNISEEKTTVVKIDKTAPTHTRAEVKNITTTGYDVYVYGVTDGTGSGVNRVQFPTWTTANNQDDIQSNWETNSSATGVKQADGTTWVYHVNVTDHKNEYGEYRTHVYAYDNLGNRRLLINFNDVQVPGVVITLNANGGSVSTGTLTKGYGSQMGTLPTPTRAGYTFTGWYTAATGGTRITEATTVPANNVTYYAQWTVNNYTVTYNANGGTGSMATDTVIFDQNYTTKANAFTKTGYTFKGWNEKADGTGTDWTNWIGKPWKWTYARNVTLYAQWTRDNYTITYNLNGGAVTGQPTSYNVESNNITLPTPTKTGYTFTGWTGSNGTTPQTTVTIPKGSTGNKSYTANWTVTNYTITYNLNGGTITGQPTSYNIESNEITLPTPTKTGYTFTGWTGSNGTTAQTTVKIAKGSTGNKSYTANWSINSYYIDLNLNVDGTAHGSGYNSRVTVGFKVGGVDKGYIQDYYTQHTYGTTWEIYGLKLDGEAVAYTASGTLGAQNTGVYVNLNTVNFVANNSSYGTVSVANRLVVKGTNYTTSGATVTLAGGRTITATKTDAAGYTTTFSNWTPASGTVNAATTITANFTRTANKYTISYNANGGTGSMTTDTVTYNTNYTTKANAFTKTGYTFKGWNEKADGTGTDWTSWIGKPWQWTYTRNVTLYAQWTRDNYTITYNLNGGAITGQVTSYNVESNAITLPTPTKTGYTFTGWTGSNGTTAQKTVTIAKGSTGNKSYTANWSINSYTIDLNLNVDGTNYYSGYNSRVKVGLKVGGVDKGYVQDYGGSHQYGTSWEMYGLELDGEKVAYSKTGTLGAGNASIFAELNTVTFKVNNADYGTVSATNRLVARGTNYTTSGATVTLAGGRTVTATKKDATGHTTTFSNWTPASGTVNAATTVTANFTRTANDYTLTVNPNGGTWGGKTTNSTVTQKYNTTKSLGNATPPAGYAVTFNGNGGTSTQGSITSTKSFSSWTKSGSGSYIPSVADPSTGGMTMTKKTDTDGMAYYNYAYNVSGLTGNTWYWSRFPAYAYTAGSTYEIRFKVRVNSSSGGDITFRHAALGNDYGTPGLVVKNFTAATSGWQDVTMTRTFTGTTTTLNNNTVTIAPVFELYTGNLMNRNAAINFDVKDIQIINTSTGAIVQSSNNSYLYGAGAGTVTANYTNNAITLPNATRTGYTFNGWYTAASGGTKVGNAGAQWTPTAATTLYAHWTVNSYTVTYNYAENGGKSATKTTATVNYGSAIDLSPTAAKDGYNFVGWNTNKDATSKLNSLNMSTGNVTLYAIYSKTITGTFNYFNGTAATSTPVSQTIYNKTTQVTLKAPTLANASKDSITYTARGWSTSNAANAIVNVASGANVTLSSSATYYASYQATITATFYYHGGTDQYAATQATTTASATRFMNYAGTYTQSNIAVPSAVSSSTGYYGTTYKGVSNAKSSGSMMTPTTANTAYYAVYNVGITYYYYDGSKHASSTATRTATTNGTTYSCSVNAEPKPSAYDGANFKWWSYDVNQAGSDYKRTPTTTASTSLYAVYEKSVTATFYYHTGDNITNTQASTTASGIRNYISKSGGVNTKQSNIAIPAAVTGSSTYYTTAYKGVATAVNSSTGVTPTTANTKYYAFYDCSLTYYYYNGSAHTSSTTTRRARSNGTNYVCTVDSTPTPSAYDGAAFKWWSYDANQAGSDYQRAPNATGVQALYAMYQKSITATFNYYNGTKAATTTASATRSYISKSGGINTLQANIGIPAAVSGSKGVDSTTYSHVSTSKTGSATTPNTATTTYYAVYKKTVTATKYVYNNSSSTATGTAYAYYDGTKTNASINLGTTTLSGYTPRGWSTSNAANATVNVALNGNASIMNNTTYYMSYTYGVTLTYNANNGTGAPAAQSGTAYMNYTGTKVGATITLSTTKPTRQYYTFSGWYTETSGGTKLGTTYTITGNTTIYAQWSGNVYTVTLNNQSATSAGSTAVYEKYGTGIYKETACTNKMTTSANAITKPSRSYTLTYNANGGTVSGTSTTASYTFGGYYTATGGGGDQLINANGNITTAFTTTKYGANATLYAKWTRNDISLATPTRAGYTFKGWFTATSGGTQITSATSITANQTIYAQWAANTYTVNYNANGGTGTMASDTATYEANYTTKANAFTRTGYTFKGWNEKADGTGTDWTNWIGKPWKWAYTNNITLYAQWTVNTYTVSYNANGGTGTMASDTITYGQNYTAKANAFTRTGYTFKGWNEKADGTGTDWTNWIGKPWQWTYTNNITLYAQWTVNTYTQKVQVRYENVDGTFTGYSDAINKNYAYGSTVSWSRAADSTYQAASITSYTVTGAKTTQVTVYRQKYTLDLNGYLDGTSSGNLGAYGKADVYINGSRVSAGVTDFCKEYRAGTTYEIKNIVANNGYVYEGLHSGTLTGTLTKATGVWLKFVKRDTLKFTNITRDGFTVEYYSANDITAARQVAIWTSKNGQDDIVWHALDNNGGGKWSKRIYVSSHNYEYGEYNAHVYDNPATSCKVTGKVNVPYEERCYIYGVSSTGYKVRVYTNRSGVTKVEVPTWTSKNGQDDIEWINATSQGYGAYLATVKVSNHNYESGEYNSHVYLTINGSKVGIANLTANVTATAPPAHSCNDADYCNVVHSYPYAQYNYYWSSCGEWHNTCRHAICSVCGAKITTGNLAKCPNNPAGNSRACPTPGGY